MKYNILVVVIALAGTVAWASMFYQCCPALNSGSVSYNLIDCRADR